MAQSVLPHGLALGIGFDVGLQAGVCVRDAICEEDLVLLVLELIVEAEAVIKLVFDPFVEEVVA